MTRLTALFDARCARRKARVLTLWELETELNNLISSIGPETGLSATCDLAEWQNKLAEIAADLDEELHPPELPDPAPRLGDFDCFTKGVHGRGY